MTEACSSPRAYETTASTCSSGAVMVQVSTSPGFDRIWDRDGSGPRFDLVQDSPLLLT